MAEEGRSLAAAEIQAELAAGETLLWAGQPKQGFALRGYDIALIPFSLIWSGAAIVALIVFLIRGGGFRLLLMMSPFLFGTAYLFAGRFWLDAKTRAATYYALTDQRLIFIVRWPYRRVESVELQDVVETQLTRRTDGTSTVEFLTSHSTLSRILMPGYIRGLPWTSMYHIPPAFEMIADGQEVREMINQVQISQMHLDHSSG